MKWLGAAVAAVQVVDLLLHAAAGQLEPLRVASNAVILLWVGALALGGRAANARLIGGVALAAYVVLNGVFLALAGFTNPAQGNAPRVALLVLVALTTVLSLALIYLHTRRAAS
jgi:hypothetical protein